MDMNKTRGSSQGLIRSSVSPESPSLPSVSSEGKIRVDTLIEQIDSIVLLDTSDSSAIEESHRTWMRDACNDSDTLKYAFERIHHYWLSNPSAVIKAAMFLCSNYMFEVDGLKLRQDLLLCLQRDFENRQEIQAKSPEKFLNAAAFLIEMYTRIRIENLPLVFMATPVFQYLEDLLNGDDSEMELFAHLVLNIASTLQETQATEKNDTSLASILPLQKLLAKVRSILMSRNLSSQSRLWLLFIVDISSSGNFSLPSPSLQEFYRSKDQLGSAADNLFKLLLNTSVAFELADETKHSSQLMTERVLGDKISEIKISPKPNDLVNAEKPSSLGQKRTTGRNGAMDKRDNFRSAFQVESSKGSKGKGYWLHDDRFDKDDSTSKERGNFSKPRVSQGNWKNSPAPKEERDSKPMSSNNWRQPQNKSRRDYRETAEPKQADLLAGHQLEENWEEEEPKRKPNASGSNWREPQSPRAQTEPIDLLAGHQLEENWDE